METKKICWILIPMLILCGCTSTGVTQQVYDVEVSFSKEWNATVESEYSLSLLHKDNPDVSIILSCPMTTEKIEMTGEEYVSQTDIDVLAVNVKDFSMGRKNVKVEKSEILRDKSSPVVHIRLSFDGNDRRYVHERNIFVYNNRMYSLSAAWPEDAKTSEIQAAEKVVASLKMK